MRLLEMICRKNNMEHEKTLIVSVRTNTYFLGLSLANGDLEKLIILYNYF